MTAPQSTSAPAEGVCSSSADSTGPIAWMVERQCDPTFPRLFMSHDAAAALLNYCNVAPLPTIQPLYLGVAQAWQDAKSTWEYIEHLLTEECGLRPDEGLQGQRANCINAIQNATFVAPSAAMISAAIEFLNSGEGLHKIRVNGKMLDRKAVAKGLTLPSTHSGAAT